MLHFFSFWLVYWTSRTPISTLRTYKKIHILYTDGLGSLKGTVLRDFLLQDFFMNPLPPKPLKITLGSFRIFSKIHGFAGHGAPPLSTSPAANFDTSSACVVDTGGKFSTGVNDTGGKFAAESTTPVASCHRYQRHRRPICHRCL
jgi:hypothetical protein